MKISEIRNMTIDELNEKLTDTSKKLSQLKFSNSVQTIENPLETVSYTHLTLPTT